MPASAKRERVSLKEQEAALREGRILGYACTSCGTRHQTPVLKCQCGKGPVEVTEFATQGVVETYTIQNIASEAFLNEVPFAWVIVKLDGGGPSVSGWIPFIAKPADLKLGQRVRFVKSYKPGMTFEKI